LSEINGSETFIHVSHEQARLVVQGYGVHPLKIGSEITVFVRPREPVRLRRPGAAGGRSRRPAAVHSTRLQEDRRHGAHRSAGPGPQLPSARPGQ
ncbi:MAG: hypothetical protein M0C28_37610, partial [Candidatus Moduliflexus flocculans]|nr:hypothetical protein [Candidatus Moduliflexus flocculans]